MGARKMVYLDLATAGGLVIELIEYPAQASDVSQHAESGAYEYRLNGALTPIRSGGCGFDGKAAVG